MLFDILALTSTIVVIAILNRLINIYPSLMACTIRWKENINIHNSLKLRTDRNLLAMAMIIPFCLVIDRYISEHITILSEMPDAVRLLTIIGAFLCYICIRGTLSLIIKPVKGHDETFMAAQHSSRTFFIILSLTLIATVGCFSLLDPKPERTMRILIWILSGIYLIFILRKTQILLSSYSFFASFLYLCALEILPTGVLVTSVVIF